MIASGDRTFHAFSDCDGALRPILDLAAAAIAALARSAGLEGELALPAGNSQVRIATVGAGASPVLDARLISSREAAAIGLALAAAMRCGIPENARLSAWLDLSAACGYAIEPGGTGARRASVAAAIVDANGKAVAALGLAGPAALLPPERLHLLGAAIVEAARAPTTQAGGSLRPLSTSPRPSRPVARGLRRLPGPASQLGESPLYDPAGNRLWWVDMYGPAIHRLDLAGDRHAAFDPGEMVTALALHAEGLLAAAGSGLWLLDPADCSRRRFMGDPEGGIPASRFNDGRCDRAGRFWVNTVDKRFAPGAGALYRRDGDGQFTRMDASLDVPNGMAWSPDGRVMYLADTGRRAVYAYDFDSTAGTVSGRRVFARLAGDVTGAPDGLDVDARGDLWVALFDGWRLHRYAPSGDLCDEIVLPVPRPTSCRFGGPAGRTLFVTSARIRISDSGLRDAPESGATFALPT